MYEIRVDEDSKVIYVKFYGTYGLEVINSYHLDLLQYISGSNIYILEDYTEGEPDLSSSDIDPLIKIAKRTLETKAHFKVAVASKSPKATAISQFYGSKIDSDQLIHKVFTSRKAAMNWLTT